MKINKRIIIIFLIITMSLNLVVSGYKEHSSKIGEVVNIGPNVSLSTDTIERQKVPLIICTDYEDNKLMDIKNKVDQIKAKLLPYGICLEENYISSDMYTLKSRKKFISKQHTAVPKHVFHRYFHFIYKLDHEYDNYKGREEYYYGRITDDKIAYESAYLNPYEQNPPDFKFSDQFVFEYSDNYSNDTGRYAVSYDHWNLYDPNAEATSKKRWSITLRQISFSGSYLQQWYQMLYDSFKLDNFWTDEGIKDINEEVEYYGLDMDILKNYYSNNDKNYALFISDGDINNDASNNWGEYYSFGCIQNNNNFINSLSNFNMYTVTNNNVLDYKLDSNAIKFQDYYMQGVNLRQIINNGVSQNIYNKGDYIKALDDICNKLIASSKIHIDSQYAIASEDTIRYNTKYFDHEGDTIYKNKWKYTHDPNYFENSNGKIDFDNKELEMSKERLDKVGKYEITYAAQDNPLNNDNFENYRKWSNTATKTLYVHRRPFARFYVDVYDFGPIENTVHVRYHDRSYDLDHLSLSNKGIVEWKWSWKKSGDKDFKEGEPTRIIEKYVDYIVQLRVKDMEGAWSEPYELTFSSAGANNKPISFFTLQDNPMLFGASNLIIDKSFDVDNDPIVERHFWLLDNINNVLKDFGNSIPSSEEFRSLVPGNYKLKQIVKDDPTRRKKTLQPLWSDPYVLSFVVFNPNQSPTISLSYSPSFAYEGDDVTIKMLPQDPDNDLLTVKLEQSTDNANWTTVYNQTNIQSGAEQNYVLKRANVGNYYFRATAIDPSNQNGTAAITFTVSPLEVQGLVLHTDLWDQHRVRYNISKTKTDNEPRHYDWFFPGEKFILKANTTNINPKSNDKAIKVTVEIENTLYNTELINNKGNEWVGFIWDKKMMRWSSQNLNFIFKAYYKNEGEVEPTVKVYKIPIKIDDEKYYRLHRKF